MMIVAITDGWVNLSLKQSTDPEAAASAHAPKPSSQKLKDEILDVAGKMYNSKMSLLVIDTENKFVSAGFAKEISSVVQGMFTFIQTISFLHAGLNFQLFSLLFYIPGKYYYLPNASHAIISATTKDALSALKST